GRCRGARRRRGARGRRRIGRRAPEHEINDGDHEREPRCGEGREPAPDRRWSLLLPCHTNGSPAPAFVIAPARVSRRRCGTPALPYPILPRFEAASRLFAWLEPATRT